MAAAAHKFEQNKKYLALCRLLQLNWVMAAGKIKRTVNIFNNIYFILRFIFGFLSVRVAECVIIFYFFI